jgi:hypothetical protein
MLYFFWCAARCFAQTCFFKKGLSFISNRQRRKRRKEGTFCASELAGIEPTPPAPEEQGMPAFTKTLYISTPSPSSRRWRHVNGKVKTEQRNHDSVHSRPLGSRGHGAARTDGTGRAVFLSLRPRPLSRGRRRAVGHGSARVGAVGPVGDEEAHPGNDSAQVWRRRRRDTDRRPRRRSWAPVLVPDGGSRPGPGCTGSVECRRATT